MLLNISLSAISYAPYLRFTNPLRFLPFGKSSTGWLSPPRCGFASLLRKYGVRRLPCDSFLPSLASLLLPPEFARFALLTRRSFLVLGATAPCFVPRRCQLLPKPNHALLFAPPAAPQVLDCHAFCKKKQKPRQSSRH